MKGRKINDAAVKPKRYNEGKPENEAEARKLGGRTKRKSGGVCHYEKPEDLKHAKDVGKVEGDINFARGDRKARKSGGRTGCDSNPFSSAR